MTIITELKDNGTGNNEESNTGSGYPLCLEPYADQRRWVFWKSVPSKTRDKPEKWPYIPSTRGKPRLASSKDPNTWRTLEEAIAANNYHGGDGIGFMLNGDGVHVIDLDECLVIGEALANFYAHKIIKHFDAPVELSPSDAGLHIWFRANYEGHIPANQNGRFELYRNNRFIAVTGFMTSGQTQTSLPDRTRAVFMMVAPVGVEAGSRSGDKSRECR